MTNTRTTRENVAEAVALAVKMRQIKSNTRMLGEVLDDLGIKVDDVAKQCGVTRRTVIKWRGGQRPAKTKQYKALKRMLAGVDIDDLFDAEADADE